MISQRLKYTCCDLNTDFPTSHTPGCRRCQKSTVCKQSYLLNRSSYASPRVKNNYLTKLSAGFSNISTFILRRQGFDLVARHLILVRKHFSAYNVLQLRSRLFKPRIVFNSFIFRLEEVESIEMR